MTSHLVNYFTTLCYTSLGVDNSAMSKAKNPLLALGAIGRLGKAIVYTRRRKVDIVETSPFPEDAKSLAQLSWRHMYQKAVALWHALSATEKEDWESLARRHHMTGFAYFISQALRPNPGLYLPLQGGTMAGDIDMAKYHLLRLPVPAGAQEPLRVAEYNSAIAPYLYWEGAKVTHSAQQIIPTATDTTLAFDTEFYDTDAIHDNVVNNSRLTCKTAGKYLIIGMAIFLSNPTGRRVIYITTDGTIDAIQEWDVNQNQITAMHISTIHDLAVNDYAELRVRQESGGNLNISQSSPYTPLFMMQRIGNP